jgi:hypothetical protein
MLSVVMLSVVVPTKSEQTLTLFVSISTQKYLNIYKIMSIVKQCNYQLIDYLS